MVRACRGARSRHARRSRRDRAGVLALTRCRAARRSRRVLPSQAALAGARQLRAPRRCRRQLRAHADRERAGPLRADDESGSGRDPGRADILTPTAGATRGCVALRGRGLRGRCTIRGPSSGSSLDLRRHARQRRRDRRPVQTSGRQRARDRARGGAHADDVAGGDPVAARPALPTLDRTQPRRRGPSPDPPCRDQLVVRAARCGGTSVVAEAVRVRRRLRHSCCDGDRGRRRAGRVRRGRPARFARLQVTGRARRGRGRQPLPVARERP